MAEEKAVDLEQLDADLKKELEEDLEIDEGTPPEHTEAEQKAIAKGWNPDKDSLEGTDKEWISAAEFLRNQTFFDEMKKLKREIKSQQKITEAFKEQNKIVSEKAYQKAVKELKVKKAQAANDEDFSGILQIDEELETLRDERQEATASEKVGVTKEQWDTAFETFVDENDWYNSSRVKRAFADTIGTEYVREHPGAHPDDVYKHVLKEVQTEFPKEEKTPQRAANSKAATVASSARRGSAGGKKHTMSDIPDEHKSIAMTLVKTGQVSEEDYLKQYFPEDY